MGERLVHWTEQAVLFPGDRLRALLDRPEDPDEEEE
jgi:hypothetical protein